ncbi:hypothetical protein J1N35_031494 [Gossypium stocksii]|uniref:Uncharacterized protein n=1 Tax=Gossypium stocksii TaxID=47602 RepID=A0A9D3V2P7_9ROSI|nr:hypothetical protein J1N35_031494 [Gossypium stocksii]
MQNSMHSTALTSGWLILDFLKPFGQWHLLNVLTQTKMSHEKCNVGEQFLTLLELPTIFFPRTLSRDCLQLDVDLASFKECRLLQASHLSKQCLRSYVNPKQPSDDLFKIGLIMDEVLGFNAGIMMPYFINALGKHCRA